MVIHIYKRVLNRAKYNEVNRYLHLQTYDMKYVEDGNQAVSNRAISIC